jgi:hypothetical protein
VSEGTTLTIIDASNAEWWKVETEGGDEVKIGFVPASMVDVTSEGGVEQLFTVTGRHDQVIKLVPEGGGEERTLLDRAAMAPPCELTLPEAGKALPKESGPVWGKLTEALKAEDWKAAREAKTAVEQSERVLRKQPGFSFSPELFTLPEDGADWDVVADEVGRCLADCGVSAA